MRFRLGKVVWNIDYVGATSCLADCLLVVLPVVLREKRKRASDFVILLLALFALFSLVRPPFFVTHPFYRPFRLPFSSFLSFFILSYSLSHSSHHPLLSVLLCILVDFFLAISPFLPTLHIIVLLSILVVVGIELTFPNGRPLPRLNEHFHGRRAFPSAIVGYCERMRCCPANATNTGRRSVRKTCRRILINIRYCRKIRS